MSSASTSASIRPLVRDDQVHKDLYRAEQAVLLLSAHIATSQAEVRKITLHEMHMARSRGQAEAP